MPTADRNLVAAAMLDAEFRDALSVEEFRFELRRLIVRQYFDSAAERHALSILLNIPVEPASSEIDQLIRDQVYGACREAKFRLSVVPAYAYTCALTEFRMITRRAGAIVDAAHIHRFSDSRNNDPSNGIALSKNAHWMFDNGLWAIDDAYCVIVASDGFDEAGPNSSLLRSRAGKPLKLPDDPLLRPNLEYVRWHRANVFAG